MGGKLRNSPAETGLEFFGRVSASISHEIKNALAIINENAGLLEDFAFMAERGKPLDPERMKSLAAAVQKQVSRVDQILKNLNRFSHSIDENVNDVDLGQLLELAIALTERVAAMRQVKVDLQQGPQSPTIKTAPFHLIHLICQCLDFCMSSVCDDRRLELSIAQTADSVLIHFNRLAGPTPQALEGFPFDSGKRLLELLAADLTAEPGGEKITLRLPNKSE